MDRHVRAVLEIAAPTQVLELIPEQVQGFYQQISWELAALANPSVSTMGRVVNNPVA